MNIGFDAKRAFFNKSGLGNYSRTTLLLLDEFHHENKYFLYSSKNNNKNFTFENTNFTLKSKTLSFLPSFLWRSFGISYILKKDKIDIFHGLSNELPLNIKKSNVKTIVTIHDLIFLKYPKLYKSFDRWMYNFKCKKSAKNADIIIAVSEQTKQDIIDFYNIDEKKIKVIFQTCNDFFKQKYSEIEKNKVINKFNLPSNFILNVGTIEERKNLLNIIKAVELQNIDIKIVAIGKKTEYFEKIEKYLISKNLKSNLIVLENVSNYELAIIYQLAKMLVYPSKYEGFGIPIIEALFSEIPVITTKGYCFSEAGGNAALYVNPENIEELGLTIKKLLTDNQLQQTCISNGIIHRKFFDKKLISEKLNNIYLSLKQ
ncbi:MAG: hypothetical protein A2W98_13390 [Bacteroidetes bacterium GWF2_33_38]|nr:MAG: hypothetical protein A2W98_13390 [Bacteroidetes bacterium GWF2_33_38]OFY74288.1 MAG: hypothetical protein A2265_03460 [Bacteroidetes bacterium RIFOXYA12_FULL_33_9]OFY87535.1 MAG: hypothetical protein A2236_14130 [Bacteroidetes bacterium RIFOXYA2_FULL_33_7]